MKEKQKFAVPDIEIIVFPKEDIITASGDGGNEGIELPDHEW